MDAYQVEFYRRVRQGYLELARRDPQRWVTIDASPGFEQVQAALRQVILEKIGIAN
jgi:dTMP kinase